MIKISLLTHQARVLHLGGDDPWTEQEEAILNEGVQEFGTNWTLILYKYDVLTCLMGGGRADAKLPSNSV